jgi:hypothetical protein
MQYECNMSPEQRSVRSVVEVDKSLKKHHTHLNLRFSLRRESRPTQFVPEGDRLVRSPA